MHDWISLLLRILWGVLSLLVLHYPLFALIGLFAKKRFPKTERRGRYAIVIGARNEERVIARLLQSIWAGDYPNELLTVYVVAHNCNDRTASIARANGATVFAYTNPAERTVGYAYRYLFDRLQGELAADRFDGVFIINADNTVSPDYISRMNDAFWAYDGKAIVTSFRNASNFGDNWLSCLYGIFFLAACRYESRGRAALGCSTRVSGTGYVMPASLLNSGWPYVTLTEDWELTADQIARGTRIAYCDEAEFFDEQPTTAPIMFRQRMRWAKGHMIVFFRAFPKVLGSVYSSQRSARQRFASFDAAVSLLPLGVIGLGLTLLSFCLGGGTAVQNWLIGLGTSYLLTVVSAWLLLMVERARIRSVPLLLQLVASLLWPFFVALSIFLDAAALFVRRVEWHAIPHGTGTSN